jgi:CO/xanthine dehydrogenase FAD-binding subunit
MAPTVRRCPALETTVASHQWPRRLEDWLDLVRIDLDAIDDHRSTRAYREQVLARLLLAWSESYRSAR